MISGIKVFQIMFLRQLNFAVLSVQQLFYAYEGSALKITNQFAIRRLTGCSLKKCILTTVKKLKGCEYFNSTPVCKKKEPGFFRSSEKISSNRKSTDVISCQLLPKLFLPENLHLLNYILNEYFDECDLACIFNISAN